MKRKIVRTNNIDKMTKEDWKEANETTKSTRGLSSLSIDDLLGVHESESIDSIREKNKGDNKCLK
ncbi:hypothetical protein [Bacillus infantis]|uniref:hypothetical protein n=1 Tax=Bacillus infantis TaxID=324767 RepID=UPI003CF24B89